MGNVVYPKRIRPTEQAFLNNSPIYGYLPGIVMVWSQTDLKNSMAIAAFKVKSYKTQITLHEVTKEEHKIFTKPELGEPWK